MQAKRSGRMSILLDLDLLPDPAILQGIGLLFLLQLLSLIHHTDLTTMSLSVLWQSYPLPLERVPNLVLALMDLLSYPADRLRSFGL